jgi:hypothetical protein
MSVDPAVAAAANTYLSLPMNFGEPTNLILIAEKDAWVAAVEWLVGHPDEYARLSRQKPITDAQVEAAAKALAETFGEEPHLPWDNWGELSRDEFRQDARTALEAARDVS